ncbi:hypothetical protein C8Q80DRAFT_1267051 [Daedaleopsis nitida]|nr:hypothetical protein C8Q80DRAFT_1267051 [Daedaleopsis nitida]
MVRLYALLPLIAATATLALDTVTYGVFVPDATSSVAKQLGFFEAVGLDVVFHQVASSADAFASLFAGQVDILSATVDNALNLRFNLNEGVTVLGQLDQGPDLVLASVPSITNVSQLQGKPLIVDSPASGYSFLLRHVLSTFGLELANGDYFFQTVGGTATRFQDLLSGSLPNGTTVFATILTWPVTIEGGLLPSGQAPNILARISDFVAPITSSTFNVREESLSNDTQVALLTRFLASMLAANRFLLDPANANCAIGAIANELGVSMDVAALEYASATNSLTGEISPDGDFTVSQEGIMNDVVVRLDESGFSGLPEGFNFTEALEPGSGKLIDYSVRDAALKFLEDNMATLTGNCTP